MSRNILAQRYAEAFADVAEQADGLERVRRELLALSRGVAGSRLFGGLIRTGRFSRERKLELVERMARELKLGDITARFLRYLTERNRLGLLEPIAEQFSREADRRLDILPAVVSTPVEMTEEQESMLRRKLRQVTGKRVRLQWKKDESLLAGLRVRIGNRLFDGTLRGRFERLCERISHGAGALHTA